MSPAVKKTNFSAVTATVAVLYFLVLMEACGCCAAREDGRFFQTNGARNRELIEVGASLEVLKGNALKYRAETTAATAHVTMNRWRLREVPLGPDPLHHNVGSPQKPRITPP